MSNKRAPSQIRATSDLDLTSAPAIIFLFGLTAAGKNFVGDVLARASRRHVYHADIDLTDEMKNALALKAPFSPAMRDRFFEIVACKINQLVLDRGPLIVTQAVYKERHREYLKAHVPGLELILVDSTDALIAQRIRVRGGEITQQYAEKLRKEFEPPDNHYKRILNNAGPPEILAQARSIYFPT